MSILFSRIADDTGTNGNGVATSVWDYTQSGDTPNSRFFYRNDTPIPITGNTLYFRNDFQNLQHDSYNIQESFGTINMTPGQTYYMGACFRFDRIGGADVWHDTSGPDSYDKLLEFDGNVRWIILAGWPNGNYTGSYNGQYTYDLYSSPAFCTSCGANEKFANVAPYGQSNPYLCDYDRWYAVVMAYKPSSGGSSTDGLVELFINGTKTTSLAQKTQDSATPNITRFAYSGTVAQPAYDAPAHYRKFDYLIFTDSLTDITNSGLMSDPETAGGGGTLALFL